MKPTYYIFDKTNDDLFYLLLGKVVDNCRYDILKNVDFRDELKSKKCFILDYQNRRFIIKWNKNYLDIQDVLVDDLFDKIFDIIDSDTFDVEEELYIEDMYHSLVNRDRDRKIDEILKERTKN